MCVWHQTDALGGGREGLGGSGGLGLPCCHDTDLMLISVHDPEGSGADHSSEQ